MSAIKPKISIFWGIIIVYLALVPTPFMHLKPPFAILALVFLYMADARDAFATLRSRWRSVFLFSSLFWFYLFGMTYTQNVSEGWIDVVLKLSLLLFPLIFAAVPNTYIDRRWIRRLESVFVLSVSVVAIITLGISAYKYYFVGMSSSVFYYADMMYFEHPSYYALYVNLSILLLIRQLIAENSKAMKSHYSTYFKYSLLFFLVFFVVLLQSKGGLVSLLLMLCSMAVYYWYHYKKRVLATSLVVLPLLTFLLLYLVMPSLFGRMNDMVSVSNKEVKQEQKRMIRGQGSSMARVMLWKEAIALIKEYPILGVGTGDSEDVFQNRLRSVGLIDEQTTLVYNAHSQFLQLTISLGVLGLACLCLLIFFPIVYGFKQKKMHYMAFAVMFAFNVLVESMFERQAGIMFFAFFNAYFFYIDNEECLCLDIK